MPGFVFYDGPSKLDGAPILGIAVTSRSRNRKTGEVIQTYILRADVDPVTAIRTGEDSSICGDCIQRPYLGGECYVEVPKSVYMIFQAWIMGGYRLADPATVARALAGRIVRIGAYGDPAAIPTRHWKALLRFAAGHTGYTHQWRKHHAQGLRSILMASADSARDRDIAQSMGWRTFRVRSEAEPIGPREVVCPASAEAGFRRQCISCKACDGAARGPVQASIVIIQH